MIYNHSIGRAVQYFPHHTAVLRGGQSLTFLELDVRVRMIAAALRRRGLRSGDRLAFLMPNGVDYIEVVYACSLLGAIAVPINTRYASAEIDRLLDDSQPRGLIRHSKLAAPPLRPDWEHVIDLEPFGEMDEQPHAGEFYDRNAILLLLYTSGTTGKPKGAALTHSNVFQTFMISTIGWSIGRRLSFFILRQCSILPTFRQCLLPLSSVLHKRLYRTLTPRRSARPSKLTE
jgi:acyl-CoA synthetase (AMP-forming)/AMP-acid ligase II